MIVLLSTFGLANRLFFFARYMELARVTGQTLICVSFPEADDFEGGKSGGLLRWPPAEQDGWKMPKIVQWLLHGLLRRYVIIWTRKWPWLDVGIDWTGEETCDRYCATDAAFVKKVNGRWLTIIAGWFSLVHLEIPNHEEVRSFFTPRKAIRDVCRGVLDQARDDVEVLIGIHIRWGDYKNYADGDYFFPLEKYQELMHHFVTLFPRARVGFLVVSDQPSQIRQAMASFGTLRVKLGPGTKLGDLYSLAGCDYIMCPDSTFSLWAAFYGKKPVWALRKNSKLPALSDFVVPEDYLYELHSDFVPWVKDKSYQRPPRP